MANIRIQVIGVNDETVTKGSKSYNKLTVTYKNLNVKAGESPKVEVKSVMSFTYPDVYKALKGAVTNDLFSVTSEKVGEYWNWTEIFRDDGTAPAAVETPKSPTIVGVGGVIQGKTNTYEVNNQIQQERLAFDREKQPLIIRQSCLSTAVDFLKGTKATKADVFALATELEQWVNGESLNQMSDDIPE